ncbi:MAG: LytR C-terminal domain-containing protein [Gemmatimonadales bacterium]
MERARRHVLGTLIALAAIATTAAALALRGRPDRVPAHAFAIPSVEDRVVVEVLNGTGHPGLARSATRVLRRQGLDVVFFGNWEGDGVVRKTKIVVRRGGDQAAARRVAAGLGAGAVVVDVDTLRRVDVTVILGEDWKAPANAGP